MDTSRSCGFDPSLDGIGNCILGPQRCVSPGMWTMSAGAIPPTAEVCNGDDIDCDRMSDEGVRVTCWVDGDRDGYAASGATTLVQCPPCPAGHAMRDRLPHRSRVQRSGAELRWLARMREHGQHRHVRQPGLRPGLAVLPAVEQLGATALPLIIGWLTRLLGIWRSRPPRV